MVPEAMLDDLTRLSRILDVFEADSLWSFCATACAMLTSSRCSYVVAWKSARRELPSLEIQTPSPDPVMQRIGFVFSRFPMKMI